ncbi:MAG: sulfatase-like hydrolase/transferase [Verrucomicrobiae bacterium]|nr:sulfatase-like hydrolase/transferase [Verrucomicrobiae bacterium]
MALSVSMANLLMIRAWFSILYDEDFGYYNRQPVNLATLLALLVSLLALAGVTFLGLQLWRRLRWRWSRPVGVLFSLALLLIPVNFFRLSVLDIPGATIIGLAKHPLFLAGSAAGCFLVFWRWTWAARFLRAVLFILLPLSLLSGGKLLLVLGGVLKLRQHEGPPKLASLLPEGRSQPRLIWLVFDELDFRLVFQERPAGLCLPELDRLRAEALFATHARPPAYGTLLSMPALTTGELVRKASPCSPFDLQLEVAATGEIRRWSQMPNIFEDARRLGYNNAIVAWHHPYRRVFSNVVSVCEWFPSPVFEQARGSNFTAALVNQWCSMVAPLQQRRLQIRIQQQAEAAALQMVTNRQLGLVFLHLPPPHKPGIYVPEKDAFTLWQFSTVQGYWDNLVLTDRMLGRLRAALEDQGQWENTWLVITADHAWRESHRYDGRFDERVPWLLKAPGRCAGGPYDRRFNTVVTRHLLLAIMREEVRTADAARHWLNQHAPDLPPVTDLSPNDH